jgi:hypothetical protein
MKLKQKPSLIQQPISEYLQDVYNGSLKRPNPPTSKAVEKAQFIDKTYQWKGSAANKAANVQPSV